MVHHREMEMITMTRYITLGRLREKLDGRARNSIFRDIDAGTLPKPFKLGLVNYWVEEDVDEALRTLAIKASGEEGGANEA